MVTSATIFLRDQLVACLREAHPTPMATDELIETMPEWANYRQIYRVLRALELKSQVSRAYIPGFRHVFWTSFADPSIQQEIDQLEGLLTARGTQ